MFCSSVRISYDSVVSLGWVGSIFLNFNWAGLVGSTSRWAGLISLGHIKWTHGQLPWVGKSWTAPMRLLSSHLIRELKTVSLLHHSALLSFTNIVHTANGVISFCTRCASDQWSKYNFQIDSLGFNLVSWSLTVLPCKLCSILCDLCRCVTDLGLVIVYLLKGRIQFN